MNTRFAAYWCSPCSHCHSASDLHDARWCYRRPMRRIRKLHLLLHQLPSLQSRTDRSTWATRSSSRPRSRWVRTPHPTRFPGPTTVRFLCRSAEEAFQVIANVSGTYSVTITATFTMVETVGNSTVTSHSSLSTSQSVETRAFILTFHTELSNVTNSLHQVLRNSDGSFYHDDEFVINYTYSFLFMQQRPDIKVIVEPQFDPSFVKLTSYQNSSSTGYFLFTVANRTGTSTITMTAKAFNYQGALLGSKTQKQPFAVVNYAPYFKYFTYMDYNSSERERLREAVRHARQVRREQPGLLVRRGRQHSADHRRERHPREGPDQLVQLHGDGLGHEGEPHFRRHQPGPLLLEPDGR